MSVPAMRVIGLQKRFGANEVLKRVSFEVPKGSLFGLLGPNGAGKTTLFSITAGFLKATSGTVEVLGVDVRKISELRGRFAMLPQDAALMKDVPVLEQLALFGRLEGLDQAAAIAAAWRALDFVGLAAVGERSASALSHGMAKRVAVAQTIIGAPDVIVLDEPTSGLDPENARALRDLVRRLRDEGRTVVFSSHNLGEVEELCDEVAILHRGDLLERESMRTLTGAGSRVRMGLPAPLDTMTETALLEREEIATLVRTSETGIEIAFADGVDPDAAFEAAYATLGAHGLWPRRVEEGASLEARFLELTRG